MERVAMYLRKSRADLEAEARGEGETLSKHRKQLISVAKKMNLNIIKIKEEVVSGERIIDRPEVIELLRDVEKGEYDAVLVMDIDRLGRGDMVDQGTILRAFKSSKTKIITPNKTYDLENEWDEEYTEFEAFMARRELKMITKRMQRGRVQSVKDGNYIATHAPYGYSIHKTDRERILVPHPDQAPVVRLIFDWYTHDIPSKRMGAQKIAHELNRLGYKTYTNKDWTNSSVLNVIKNPVYTGKVIWKKKETKKSSEVGQIKEVRTRPRDEWIEVPGKHQALVTEEQFQKAHDILKGKYHVPYQLVNGITNPLAGLIKCDMCESSMILRPYTKQKPHLKCSNQLCKNKSSRFEYVEQNILSGLTSWLKLYKAEWNKHKRPIQTSNTMEIKEAALKSLERECGELETQKNRLHDFLERGIYDVDTYLERSKNIAERLEKVKIAIKETESEIILEQKRTNAQKDIIPRVENVLELYNTTEDPADKNNLLKSVLDKAVYRKEKYQREDDFILVLYPKLPKS